MCGAHTLLSLLRRSNSRTSSSLLLFALKRRRVGNTWHGTNGGETC
ncbi:hypothetical protein VD0002_g4040 [Verticillium dahliae]|uniref:Uncharacterized protein n=1 Tax=Verticillium dahliae TaxID=27337 RepID=A0AA44WIY1_VERDA|nr:hypothetical protein BJF96_g6477 [Verticillium dahliae]PNH44721.1 hypothetical protein VD0004_g3035 [Verticillium dahliae]PNH57347.1 hypothetical protein VD0003_g502 [Verticillium dahliae]PNH64734.1 hypothetical protein VD0002_g4040 [Verticillium dahliae]PNH75327.1 hypothetical protein VD0001_g2212 [Verticillium dahliae]